MNTLFVGRNLSKLDEVSSTNEFVFSLLESADLAEGTVVQADLQTAGKGQRGNTWISAPYQNLTMSLVLKPRFLDANEYFFLTKVVALAAVSCLEESNVGQVEIKWPNDIYVQGKKIGGILIENQLKGSKIQTSVIGIGLNINQMEFPEGLSNATSLKRETGKHSSIQLVLESLCEKIEANYLRIKSNLHDLDRTFESCLWGINKWKSFLLEGQPTELMITGVSSHGRLIVKGRDGELRKYDFRQLKVLV